MRKAAPERLTTTAATAEAATGEISGVVYERLRQLAAAYMRGEQPGQTLQATALVHEAYLRLARTSARWPDEGAFIGFAAHTMRQILVDRARSRGAQKRWSGSPPPTPSSPASSSCVSSQDSPTTKPPRRSTSRPPR